MDAIYCDEIEAPSNLSCFGVNLLAVPTKALNPSQIDPFIP